MSLACETRNRAAARGLPNVRRTFSWVAAATANDHFPSTIAEATKHPWRMYPKVAVFARFLAPFMAARAQKNPAEAGFRGLSLTGVWPAERCLS